MRARSIIFWILGLWAANVPLSMQPGVAGTPVADDLANHATGSAAPLVANTPFEIWRNGTQPWIRVGLKEPEKVLKLSAKETLLVLDGDQVIDKIEPAGAFYIIANRDGRGPDRHWVQIAAARDRDLLEPNKVALLARHPELNLVFQPSGKMQALRAGPYVDKAEAELVRREMVRLGYDDAFLLRARNRSGFQWVNKDFDKFDLDSVNLALVRTNPEDPIAFDGDGYRGILRFLMSNDQIRVINELPLETYLRGVVPSEMGPNVFPELEALKAQAVAARTYALKNMGRFAGRGYDICDSPACQAYQGTSNEHSLSDEAVRATDGQVLYSGDELIDALYTSTCGGLTEDVANVFPGRSEPYLKSKSSYQGTYKTWTLPEKPLPGIGLDMTDFDLAARSLIYGFSQVPDMAGSLTPETLKACFQALAWIFGAEPVIPPADPLSYDHFWKLVGEIPFIRDTMAHQFHDQDLDRALRPFNITADRRHLAAFLLRFRIEDGTLLASLSDPKPMPKREALRLLLELGRILGPEPEWDNYRVEGLENGLLQLSLGSKSRQIRLDQIDYYLAEAGDRLVFRKQPVMEELDRVLTLRPPFPGNLLKVRDAGDVASVDRFSPYDTWIIKKDVADLESRARRYIPNLKGIKAVNVLQRSETGRVTLMEYVADSGTFRVDGLQIRWSLGARDNLFDLMPAYKNNRLVHLTIAGRGWGHGVGMSQIGAYGLARMGWTYDRILNHYYQDVTLRPFR